MHSNIMLEKENISKMRNCIHPNCIVCSLANYKGLQIDYISSTHKEISATICCDQTYEGYPGILHGGIITAILDGAMTNCLFAYGKTAVTVEITTKFRLPVKTNSPATVTARLTRNAHPIYFLKAEIVQDGYVSAIATAKFYDQPKLSSNNRIRY